MRRRTASAGLVMVAAGLLIGSILQASAVSPANEHFQRTWARTDQPVSSGQVSRTWMWGPDGFTGELDEPYAESPGGQRAVQYFDKARMEITQPGADANSIWYVTNGLLVVELITGRLQLGDADFSQRQPAAVNVAGDADDATGPTYASFITLLDAPPAGAGALLTKRVNRAGQVTDDPTLAGQGQTVAQVDEVTSHAIAAPFWQFMTSSGTVWDGGGYVSAPLFENAYFATGRPITEAYWANVKVAGSYQDVLMQCFERRCLTYNPTNAPEWRVEAGNVGRHYHAWRYGDSGSDPTPTEPEEPTATATEPEAPATSYAFDFAFGEPYVPTDRLDRPKGIGIDAAGFVWVADSFNDRIVRFDPDGMYIASYGSSGSAQGQFSFPGDIAFDSQGSAYVADTENDRIQKFSAAGEFLKSWGTQGTGDAQFDWPDCIEVHEDVVYVCDTHNHRIQRFSTEGAYLGQWGTLGAGPGQFDNPYGIALDTDGNIYVADRVNNRIQKFDTSFAYVSEFGDDEGPGMLDVPEAVAVDADSYVYVSQSHTIVVFEPDGDYVRSIGSFGAGLGQFSDLADIAFDAAGNLYAVEYAPSAVQRIASDGTPLWRITDGTRFRFAAPLDIAISAAGDVMVSDAVGDFGRLAYWSLDGQPGTDISYFDYVGLPPRYDTTGVAVAPGGDAYVSDSSTDNIWHFSADRELNDRWGTTGNAPGQFDSPGGVAIDADGNVYVVDTVNDRVQKFTSTGVLLDGWGTEGAGDDQFGNPIDIAIHGERVYVTDAGNQRVQVFDREGNYLDQWGTAGDGPGEFTLPFGIAVDAGGYVYVVDRQLHRIQKFTPEGEHLATFGLGGEQGFSDPSGIAVAPDGRVYVADVVKQRVLVFRPDD